MTDEKPTYEALEDRIRQLEDELRQREVLERELEAGRNILTEAERLANFGGWMWDIEQDVWSMTANWLQIHGCSKPVLSTSELLKIAHPDDLPAISAAFEQAVSLGRPYAIEHRILRLVAPGVGKTFQHGIPDALPGGLLEMDPGQGQGGGKGCLRPGRADDRDPHGHH